MVDPPSQDIPVFITDTRLPSTVLTATAKVSCGRGSGGGGKGNGHAARARMTAPSAAAGRAESAMPSGDRASRQSSIVAGGSGASLEAAAGAEAEAAGGGWLRLRRDRIGSAR